MMDARIRTMAPWAIAALLFLPEGCGTSPSGPYQGLAGIAAPAHLRIGVAAKPRDPERDAIVKREFNAVSAEGEFLWPVIHPARDTWDFSGADTLVAWTRENGFSLTATHFIWDQNFYKWPDWVYAITDTTELRTVMHEHMAAVAARYGKNIHRWITVNEPLERYGSSLYANHFYTVLGPGYIAEAFTIAAQEAPESEHWLNEIFTESNPAKMEALLHLAADLVAQGAPIDGVGIQGHLFFGDPDYALVEDAMKRIAALGLKTSITELDDRVDLNIPNRQDIHSARMAGMVKVCLAVPACESVTWWGVDDSISWVTTMLFGPGFDPLLWDSSLRPKPAYYAVRRALETGRP